MAPVAWRGLQVVEVFRVGLLWAKVLGGMLTKTEPRPLIGACLVAHEGPANLVLQHLPGCKQDGVVEIGVGAGSFVGGDGEVCGAHEGYKRPNSSSYTHKQPGHRKTFGTETIATWACQEGCPVAELDSQSGPSSSAVRKGGTGEHLDPSLEGWRFKRAEGGFTDSGGASRFFKQVGGE